jgi:hypothetical protein
MGAFEEAGVVIALQAWLWLCACAMWRWVCGWVCARVVCGAQLTTSLLPLLLPPPPHAPMDPSAACA